MSQRHAEAFHSIEKEHEAVVVALKEFARSKQRGSPGAPDFDPTRVVAAIDTAGDAYALLLIATAEGFLREYLRSTGVVHRENAGISELTDRSVKELNENSPHKVIRPVDKEPMHTLRVARNQYAHGRQTGVFPSVSQVRAILSRFFHLFP